MKTKKPTPPKQDPREAQLQTAFNACRRLNRAVRFSFIREILREMKCEDQEAESIFSGWVVAGKVAQDGEIGEVKIYFAKNLH